MNEVPAPQLDAVTPTVLNETVVQATALVAREVRASPLKSRVVWAPVVGSTKSTTTEKEPDEAILMPLRVAMSPSGASCDGPLVMRTATGSGSCRKSSASDSASKEPHDSHLAATSGPQSRTASVLTLTDHGWFSSSPQVDGSRPDVSEVTLS